MKSQRSSLILGIIVVLILVSSYAFGISVYNAEDFQRALKNKKIEYISLSGNIYGNFVLKRGDVSIDGNGYSIISSNKNKPALSILGPKTPTQRISSIYISNIRFEDGETGLFIKNVTKSSIRNCSFRNLKIGIYLQGSTYTDIRGSDFSKVGTGVDIEEGTLSHMSFEIYVYGNRYSGDGTFIYHYASYGGLIDNVDRNLKIENNTVIQSENAQFIPSFLSTNEDSRIEWENNEFDSIEVVPITATVGEEEIYQTLAQQFWTLIEKFYSPNILEKFSEPAEYRPSEDSSYRLHALTAENYLLETSKRPPEEIEKRIGDIAQAIYDLIDLPFDIYDVGENSSFENFINRIYGINHQRIFWRKENDFFNKYIFNSIFINNYTECLLSLLNIDKLTIDGRPVSYYISEIPPERGEVFRGNIVLYKRYRENVQKALKYLDWLISLGKRHFSQENVLLLEEFRDEIKMNWPSLDKVVRILLFDIPLFEIMIEMVNTMNNGTKPKLLGETIASFGPIAYYGIVGDATKKAWEYYIVKKIKKSMKGAQFEEFKEKMRQTPDWFRDSGGRLLQESY